METDDDVLVVIIGDEEESSDQHRPFQIKQEVIEENDQEMTSESVEDCIEKAERHGQAVKIECLEDELDLATSTGIKCLLEATERLREINKLKNKKKEYTEQEYLSDDLNDLDDEDYIPDFVEDSDDGDIDEVMSSDSDQNTPQEKEKHRFTMLKPSERKSFVKELCQTCPELSKDRQLLIETLCTIMKDVKRPAPPRDYYSLNGTKLECLKCGAVKETIPAIERHWQEKHGRRYLVCYACGVDFRSTTNLYKHEKRCNAPDAVIVLKARALILGRKGRGRPFVPPLEVIKIREKILNVIKEPQLFACGECSASFKTRLALQSHEFAHRGARPFRCALCPAAYTSRAGLSKHELRHTDIEFICNECSRSFKSKNGLIAHLNTHNPIRKWMCPECGRRYAQKSALQLHANAAHRRLPPPCACQICPRRFQRMSLLKTHMLKEHGMTLITQKMFYKSLPYLSESQLQKAKVVLKTELQPMSIGSPQYEYNYENAVKEMERTSNEEQNKPEQEEDTNDYTHVTEFQDYNNTEGISKEVLEVVKKIQREQRNTKDKYILIQDGEVKICTDDPVSETEYIYFDVQEKESTEIENKELVRQQIAELDEGTISEDNKGIRLEVDVEMEPMNEVAMKHDSNDGQTCSPKQTLRLSKKKAKKAKGKK